MPEVARGGIKRGADIQVITGGVATQPYVIVARSDLDLPNAAMGYRENMRHLAGMMAGGPARGSGADLLLMRMLVERWRDRR